MKNILVTGAARGIGLSVTKLLSSEGYKVYGLYNSSNQEAVSLRHKIPNLEMMQCDLSQPGNLGQTIEALRTMQFHAIVNVAGIALGDNALNFNEENWRKGL